MVQQQGIDVCLAPFGKVDQRYPEHAAPASSSGAIANSKEVYIEAVNGERSVVVVDLGMDFDAKSSPMIKIRYGLGSSPDLGGEWKVTKVRTYDQLSEDESGKVKIRGRSVLTQTHKKLGEQWFLCGFTFSPLMMGKHFCAFFNSARKLILADKELEIEPDQVSKHVGRHGKIVVSIQRGNSVTKANRERPPLWDKYVAPETLVSSKAVVKDSHVSHAIK